MLTEEMTLKGAMLMAQEYGAANLSCIYRDAKGDAAGGVFVVREGALVDLINEVVQSWNDKEIK